MGGKDSCELRSEASTIRHTCIVLFWSWEFDFFQGKAGILKSEACGNLEKENH